MKTITEIVKATPRASYARPKVTEEDSGRHIIKTGSPADACRIIDALRAAGYSAGLLDPRDSRTVQAASLACLLW